MVGILAVAPIFLQASKEEDAHELIPIVAQQSVVSSITSTVRDYLTTPDAQQPAYDSSDDDDPFFNEQGLCCLILSLNTLFAGTD